MMAWGLVPVAQGTAMVLKVNDGVRHSVSIDFCVSVRSLHSEERRPPMSMNALLPFQCIDNPAFGP